MEQANASKVIQRPITVTGMPQEREDGSEITGSASAVVFHSQLLRWTPSAALAEKIGQCADCQQPGAWLLAAIPGPRWASLTLWKE